MKELDQALSQLSDHCPQIQGAVVATREGLMLAATGCLVQEVAGACATHVLQEVENYLSLLGQQHCLDILVWTDQSLFHLSQLGPMHVLFVQAHPQTPAGLLRLNAHEAALQLKTELAHLMLPEQEGD